MNPHSELRTTHRLRSVAPLLVGLFFVLCANSVAASEETPALSLDDFSVCRWLHTNEAGGLQSVLLDFEVYERSVEAGLADLRVFDAQGRPVPYALRRRLPNEGSRTQAAYRGLPLFRLGDRDDVRADGVSDAAARVSGDYRIDAELSDSGAIVRVFRGDAPASGNSGPLAWLLDASALDRAVVGIEFDFAAGEEDFVSRILIEASDDLARWTSVRADVVVARLEQSGHRIERLRFELPGTRAKYLRLTPQGEAALPTLSAVRVQPSDVKHAAALPKESKVVSGRIDPQSPRTVTFDLAGAPSIASIQVVLPTPGSLVEPMDLVPLVGMIQRMGGGSTGHPAWTWRVPGTRDLSPWEGAYRP